MRTSDPETSEYFSRSFGTEKSEKITERQQKTLWGDNKTGEGSVREVEQYIVHPNEIRSQGTGKGIVTIPHAKGVKVLRMSFKRREDLAPEKLPIIEKKIPDLADVVCKTEQVIATPTNSL
jgi:type IV secretory pathway TraG/TraD family ATPase VirD4